jgi:hypothetical protein
MMLGGLQSPVSEAVIRLRQPQAILKECAERLIAPVHVVINAKLHVLPLRRLQIAALG